MILQVLLNKQRFSRHRATNGRF